MKRVLWTQFWGKKVNFCAMVTPVQQPGEDGNHNKNGGGGNNNKDENDDDDEMVFLEKKAREALDQRTVALATDAWGYCYVFMTRKKGKPTKFRGINVLTEITPSLKTLAAKILDFDFLGGRTGLRVTRYTATQQNARVARFLELIRKLVYVKPEIDFLPAGFC